MTTAIATTPAIATIATIATIPAANNEVVRPTEAQLRWAQFHYKRRACSVKESCDRLWQTPPNANDVEGALPEDGNSTTSGCGSDNSSGCKRQLQEIRQRRPRVSRGRRAYLRVSRRVCEERRKQQSQSSGDGYAGSLGHAGNKYSSTQGNNDNDNSNNDEDDGLDAIFAVAPLHHRRKKQRRNRNRNNNHNHNNDDDEHYKSFQAACHAMMMNMAAAAPPQHSIAVPTRRWTRTADHVAMSTEHDFTSFKFGIGRKEDHHHLHNPNYNPSRFLPMDRGASWMVHLPHRPVNQRESPYYHDANGLPISYQEGQQHPSDPSSFTGNIPGRCKFEELVAMVQQQVIARTEEERMSSIGATPKMRLRDLQNQHGDDDGQQYELYEDEHGQVYEYEYEHEYEHEHGHPQANNTNNSEPPRMRLRDQPRPGDGDHGHGQQYAYQETTNSSSLKSGPPRMRLREDPRSNPHSNPNSKSNNAGVDNPEYEYQNTDNNDQHMPSSSQPTPRSRTRDAPKMRLQEFGAGAGRRNEAVVRTVRHVPRMRLRDFAPNGSSSAEQVEEEQEEMLEEPTSIQGKAAPPKMRIRNPNEHENENDDTLQGKQPTTGSNMTAPPKMRLRQYAAGQEHDEDQLDGHQAGDPNSTAPPKMRLRQEQQQGEDQLEGHQTGDPNSTAPPKMRLRQEQQQGEEEEKKGGDLEAPLRRRRKEHPLSQNFLSVSTDPSQYSSTRVVGKLSPGTCCSKCLQPTPTGSQATASSDFFAQMRKQNADDVTMCPDCGQGEEQQQVEDPNGALYSSVSPLNPGEEGAGMHSSVSSLHPHPRISEAFSSISPLNQDTRVSEAFSSVSPLNQDPRVSGAHSSVSPLHHQDPRASSGAYSAVSPLNRDEGGHGKYSSSVTPHKSKNYPQGELYDDEHILYDDEHNSITPRAAGKDDPQGGLYDGENKGVTPRKSTSSGRGFQDNDDTKSETSLSGLWNRGRASLQTALSSSLNVIPEANQRAPSPANLHARAANVQGQVGGFFNSMLRGSKQEEDEKNEDSLALAAYRKSQEVKRESMSPDDASSHSSYRVLPAGIRSVVQGLYKSPTNQSSSSPALSSPGRSSLTRSSMGELSPEIYKDVHDKVMRQSDLLGGYDQEGSIIDTDETQSQASGVGMDPNIVASIMLSPTLLNKRLLQAVRAVEANHWQQVSYLISANPWLAEMSELTTSQYLLHKLAFFGGSAEDQAPENLNQTLLKMFPAAVHKFDRDGNVPLHLAAASGNLKMIMLLGEKFASGASIRNEDGMLPLHFAIASYGEIHGDSYGDDQEDSDDNPSPLRLVKTVLKFFPKAVAIPDNDGNLPIHIAVECLQGALGVDVVYLLLDEADRQVQDPFGARFYNKAKVEELIEETGSTITVSTEHETDSSVNADERIIHCSMVRNGMDETPLITAIKTRNGWEMIEAIAGGPGGKRAALYQDADKNNALHLLVSNEYQDPAAALSILKAAPEAASMRNAKGMLPIEIACMEMMPEEVIFAIVLVDLPVDVDDKSGVKVREGLGDSWWFLACESDDHYFEIVQEVVGVCSFQQIRELCFMKGGTSSNGGTVISRATPKCRFLLTQALRFVGRFEFVGSSALYTDSSIGLKEFDALDFGGAISNAEEGRRVILKCYSQEEAFQRETAILRDIQLDPTHVEEVLTFAVNDHDTDNPEGGGPQQYCISIERPSLTLDRVVAGMLKNDGYKRDPDLRKRYSGKVCAVLRMVAKSLKHLHSQGVVHGDLCMDNCGKYDETWKIMGTLGLQRIGQTFNPARWHESFPPEAVDEVDDEQGSAICDSDDAPVGFKSNLVAEPSIDVWAFGKLAYEMLVGDPLLDFDASKKPSEDKVTLLEVMEWDESRMKDVFHRLLNAAIPESGADLITSCLFFRPDQRPASMDEILENSFWKEMRRGKERSRQPRRSEESASVYTETSRMEKMEI